MSEEVYVEFKNDRELWEYLLNGGIVMHVHDRNIKVHLVDGKKFYVEGSSAIGCLLSYNRWIGIKSNMYQIISEKEARTLKLYPVNDKVLTTQEYIFYLISKKQVSIKVDCDKRDWVRALKTATDDTVLEVEKYLNQLIEARRLLSLIKEE